LASDVLIPWQPPPFHRDSIMLPPTRSVWQSDVEIHFGPPPSSDERCDVCVIGGGIAGLTAAYQLAIRGKRVTLLEASDFIGVGETGHTTAQLGWSLDERFTRIAELRGDDNARLAAQSHREAIDRIGQISANEAIHCNFERVPGYLFPGADGTKELEAELVTLRRLGLPHEHLTSIPGNLKVNGPFIRFPDQGQFDPVKYLNGLAGAIKKHGGVLHGGTRVTAVSGGSPATVTTEGGRTVTADAVVVAANCPFEAGMTMWARVASYTTYVVSFDMPAGPFERALWWDTEDPYHYIRTVRTSSGDRLIVGGEDHKTGQADDQPARWDRLEAWTRERFPGLGAVLEHWSGQVYETPDGLGLLGSAPVGKNVYVITGDSGMGMTHGTIGGHLVADMIDGNAKQELVDLYSPGRVFAVATLGAVGESLNMVAQYRDYLTGGDVSSADDLEPGCGGLERRGLGKVAHFRNDAGALTTLTAVCPHLGGIVSWNAGERSWDCPLHGSRFGCEGEVIHGPAVVPLKKV